MRLLGRWTVALLVFDVTTHALGQTSEWQPGPTFDVVSIRRNTGGGLNSAFNWRPDGSLTVINQPIRSLISRTFRDVSPVAAVGLPLWAVEDRYDIQGRASLPRATAEDETALLRSLLLDRFKLSFHVEKREYDVYELVVARADGRLGAGLKRAHQDVDCEARAESRRAAAADAVAAGKPIPPEPAPSRDALNGTPPPCAAYMRGPRGAEMEAQLTMSGLAQLLGGTAGRRVVDKTGLPGMYHILMTYDRLASVRGPAAADSPDAAPSVFTALQEQLGLKLEPARAEFDTVVIDSLERPTEN
jgi:uncharacterized protein (TIGR03435 family)